MKAKAPLTSSQITPGIMISVDKNIYRVESAVKVTVAKGKPFIKTSLIDVMSGQNVEKNFKEGQVIQEVTLDEHQLEFLYLEGKEYLFLDIGNLEQILVTKKILGDKVNYIKEGIEIKAMFYGDTIFSIELPQFLELVVVKTETSDTPSHIADATKIAFLETGAKIEVPLFIETGDVLKVDTSANEYIQRV
ncbi:MAG: Elongation factor P [Chlamydiae bacterium]|nr:Elongation factor P [Chlamydiota bacterium]